MAIDAQAIGYATLLSVPVGVGVALAVLETTHGQMVTLALAGGSLTIVLLFGLVLAGAHEPEE